MFEEQFTKEGNYIFNFHDKKQFVTCIQAHYDLASNDKNNIKSHIKSYSHGILLLAVQNNAKKFLDTLLNEQIITIEKLKEASIKYDLLETTAYFGHLEMLQWLHDKKIYDPQDMYSTKLILYQASAGFRSHINIIDFLFSKKIISKDQIRKTNILEGSTKNPKKQKVIIQWLINHDIYTTNEISAIRSYLILLPKMSGTGVDIADSLINSNIRGRNWDNCKAILRTLSLRNRLHNIEEKDLPKFLEYLYEKCDFFGVNADLAKKDNQDKQIIQFLTNKEKKPVPPIGTVTFGFIKKIPSSTFNHMHDNKTPRGKPRSMSDNRLPKLGNNVNTLQARARGLPLDQDCISKDPETDILNHCSIL